MTAKIVTLDIERQAGLAEVWDWKADYIRPEQFREQPRTICLAWKFLDQPDTKFAAEWQDGGAEEMVKKAHAVLDEADYVVGWNSKNFDMKHLKAHFLQFGLKPPSPYIDIDLMINLKREFKFLYNRMAYISDVLGLDGKDKTPVGLWTDLRSDDKGVVARAHVAMEKYNKRDVELTEELFLIMRPWLRGLNLGLYEEDSLAEVCPNCGSSKLQSRGPGQNATYMYMRFQCVSCGKWGRFRKSFKSTTTVGI
jgi:DNA polymerase elongation subunit (family B)